MSIHIKNELIKSAYYASMTFPFAFVIYGYMHAAPSVQSYYIAVCLIMFIIKIMIIPRLVFVQHYAKPGDWKEAFNLQRTAVSSFFTILFISLSLVALSNLFPWLELPLGYLLKQNLILLFFVNFIAWTVLKVSHWILSKQ